MIQVEELHKSFDGAHVLRGVSFSVGKGEILALIGRSGYGKSVLLKHVAGLMKADQGRVLVDDDDVSQLKARRFCGCATGSVFSSRAARSSIP